MRAPMGWVAFDERGEAFALGSATRSVKRAFAASHRTVRLELRTLEEACRLHRAHLIQRAARAVAARIEGASPSPVGTEGERS